LSANLIGSTFFGILDLIFIVTQTLIEIIKRFRLSRDNQREIELLEEIIFSFKSNGLPLGNLTSQLFANVYLNEVDQLAKHKLKVKYYIRYADDFVVFSENKKYLESLISEMQRFLENKLKLTLHPDKIFIKTLSSGLDFLGWINFPDYSILRKTTRRRILKRIKENQSRETLNSYLGLLKHGNTFLLQNKLLSQVNER